MDKHGGAPRYCSPLRRTARAARLWRGPITSAQSGALIEAASHRIRLRQNQRLRGDRLKPGEAARSTVHEGLRETAALRDFDPTYDRSGSNASRRYARDARDMSASFPIATEFMLGCELTRSARSKPFDGFIFPTRRRVVSRGEDELTATGRCSKPRRTAGPSRDRAASCSEPSPRVNTRVFHGISRFKAPPSR